MFAVIQINLRLKQQYHVTIKNTTVNFKNKMIKGREESR